MSKLSDTKSQQEILDSVQKNGEVDTKNLALLSAVLYDEAENTGERMLGGLALMGLALLWSSGEVDPKTA